MKEYCVYDIIISMKIRVFIAAAVLIGSVSFAAEKPTNAVQLRDAKDYIDTIEKVTKLKIDDQIDVWQTFLSDHPQNTFRKEIEKNIELLQSLTQKKQSGKQGDERDAELYLKALEFSKKLSPNDQIQLWQQFLDENPNSIYRNEAMTRLARLKRGPVQQAPRTAPAQPTAPRTQPAPQAPAQTKKTTVGGIKPIKDRDQALLLASLAGIVVPGMGHWYTEDYVIAGVLTGIRVGGIAIGLPGIINTDYSLMYLGGGLILLSYVLDIADAPFSADRYNESHSTAMMNSTLPIQLASNGITYPLFAYSFQF